jgi:hypothetical protein
MQKKEKTTNPHKMPPPTTSTNKATPKTPDLPLPTIATKKNSKP